MLVLVLFGDSVSSSPVSSFPRLYISIKRIDIEGSGKSAGFPLYFTLLR